MLSATQLLILLAFYARSAFAWGDDGHMTVGYIAMEFLGPKTLSFVQSSLGSTYDKSLGPAATWPDEVKDETEWEWSKPLHFVDANDSPPTSCSVEETRDCDDNFCILSAIANYTTQVADTSLSAANRQIALKFIDHFLGDVGQPLHVEALEVGGNDITVTCSGSSNNLHAVWDTAMIEQNLAAAYDDSVTTYASNLVARIQSGAYQSLTTSWLSCTSLTEPATSLPSRGLMDYGPRPSIERDIAGLLASRATKTITPLACPLVWARDANTFDCSFVFNFTSKQDLCTSSYITSAIPIIDLQLAKQGYRLAAWLNSIFDGSPLLP